MPLVSLFSKLEAKPLLRMLLVRFEENRPLTVLNRVLPGRLDRSGRLNIFVQIVPKCSNVSQKCWDGYKYRVEINFGRFYCIL